MELLFERQFAAPPAVMWPYLTDPARMCEWSEVPLCTVTLGAGQRPDAAGAVRALRARRFGITLHIEEAVVEARPPERFVYRVVRGAGFRHHEGVLSLRALPGGGTRLVWRVGMQSVVPGWDRLVGALVNRGMNRSLDALERIARAAAARAA